MPDRHTTLVSVLARIDQLQAELRDLKGMPTDRALKRRIKRLESSVRRSLVDVDKLSGK